MSSIELYTKDTRVWIPSVDKVWQPAQVYENFNVNDKKIKLIIDDESIIDYEGLPPLRNPDILIGQNDLTSLSYLNEPEVLYNLEVRFLNNNQIYTYCGIVLVAINPYEQLPIYGNELIQAYNGHDVQDLDPHIFAVAESAFQKMANYEQNQSIIVSGESGAGKTVSAKYTMRYFANVGGSSEETQIEKRVLASNPIMEAFGNAKTTRNDNSSRFGKFIQIDFNRKHHIVGASMRTYLLEKSRVVFQASNERNYHIFYQLCSQKSSKDLSYLMLDSANNFQYTSKSTQIDGVDDQKIFRETLEAFNLIGISSKERDYVFSLVSAIMHLGNVEFSQINNDSCDIKANDKSLSIMCKLLHLNEEQMKTWLCNKRIKTVNEIVNIQLSLSQAYFSRDALAKHIYSQLFNWIVSQINKCLKCNVKTHSFIGVLDIYGFETFQTNSFEQFCINYANEKLQQQFCQHVFKLEQEEYLKEQIKWSFIEFYDNQPCIELIEGKLGILDLLDEECKMPKGSDFTWCSKLYEKHLKASQHFSKPRMSQTSFIVHHFAEHVEYQADGFLEKNRDTVLEEQLKVLKASGIDFIGELFVEEGDEVKTQGYEVKRLNTLQPASKTQATRKKTVGSQFRDSLQNLMQALNSTTPHYVRCIKPNDAKAPFQFDAKRAVEQLRACGVLETVRISAAGYPSRWTYAEFFQRYRMLIHSKQINRKQIKETCEKILVSLIRDETKYQFGKTKIFFQAGQVAYLEKLRSERLKASCICVQKNIRMWLVKLKYAKIQKSTLLVQCYSRGLLARRELKLKRESRAAITIQSNWRAYKIRVQYRKTLANLIKFQALCRGFIARKNRENITRNLKATIIQAHVRGWLARLRYKQCLHGFIMLQAHFRRKQARKLYKQMKIEMRSVEHQRQLNKGLENKIISMQQTIERLNKEKENLSNKCGEIEPLKVQLSNLKMNTNVLKENNIKINDLKNELNNLKHAHESLKVLKEAESKEKEKLKAKFDELKKSSDRETNDLRVKLEEANREIKELKIHIEEMTHSLAELQSERANHQKLIKENNKLEQRFEKARQELLKFKEQQQQQYQHSDVQYDKSQLESLIDELDINSIRGTESGDENSEPSQEPKAHARKMNQQQTNKPYTPVDINSLSVLQEQDEYDFEMIKSQELEFENQKLREDLSRLRHLHEGDESFISKEIINQFNALNEEVQKRRDEVIQLKSLLVSKTRTFDHEHDYDDDEQTIDGSEFEMAYSSQKILIRMLETQLKESEKSFDNEKQRLGKELEKLKEENKRQHEILMGNIPQDIIAEETYKYELFRLTNETVDLAQKCDALSDECKKYKKVLKVYIKRSKNQAAQYMNSSIAYESHTLNGGTQSITLTNNFNNNESIMIEPQIRLKHGECMGIFEWKMANADEIINHLVTSLKPRLAVTFVPGLPAYILFMCIRYADMINDDERVKKFFDIFVMAVKKLIKKRTEDLDYIVLWLSNICRLLHSLKQYSGDSQWQTFNTPKQKDHCLKNFDLTEYRGILSDIAIWLFQGIVRDFEKKLNHLIVPAMLEHESLPEMSISQMNSLKSTSEGNQEKVTIHTLTKKLTEFLNILNTFGVDPEIVDQIFRQLFFFISASTFNNLLLRKGMCHWSKGIQIRYNLSHLEQWLRDSKLQDQATLDKLDLIIQASQLLQCRKSDADIMTIVEMCPKLTIAQIQRILFLYTPLDDFEEKLSRSFIDKVAEALKRERDCDGHDNTQQVIIIDTQLAFPITIPFNPSSIGLETIDIPNQFNLPMLKKI